MGVVGGCSGLLKHLLEFSLQLLLVSHGHLCHSLQVCVDLALLIDLLCETLSLFVHLVDVSIKLVDQSSNLLLVSLLITEFFIDDSLALT